MVDTFKKLARITAFTAGATMLVGLSTPALAMEPPEVVYAKQSCRDWQTYQWPTYEDCYDYHYNQYRSSCIMDPELNICYF